MIATNFITTLGTQGVKLSESNGKLRVEGPADLLTDGLRSELARRKPELLAVLGGDWQSAAAALIASINDDDSRDDLTLAFEERAGIIEYDANIPRTEAEHLAYLELVQAVESSERHRMMT